MGLGQWGCGGHRPKMGLGQEGGECPKYTTLGHKIIVSKVPRGEGVELKVNNSRHLLQKKFDHQCTLPTSDLDGKKNLGPERKAAMPLIQVSLPRPYYRVELKLG